VNGYSDPMIPFRPLYFLLFLWISLFAGYGNSYFQGIPFWTPPPLSKTDKIKEILKKLTEGTTPCTFEQASKWHITGERIFIDARSKENFAQGHIDGAYSISATDFESAFQKIEGEIHPGMPLVVYCSGIQCEDSIITAEKLILRGFTNIKISIEGWEKWKQEKK